MRDVRSTLLSVLAGSLVLALGGPVSLRASGVVIEMPPPPPPPPVNPAGAATASSSASDASTEYVTALEAETKVTEDVGDTALARYSHARSIPGDVFGLELGYGYRPRWGYMIAISPWTYYGYRNHFGHYVWPFGPFHGPFVGHWWSGSRFGFVR